MLINSGEGGEDKPWEYLLIFQHNMKIDKVHVEVDRKNRVIKHRIERSTCEDTDTKVTITLPTLSPKTYITLMVLLLAVLSLPVDGICSNIGKHPHDLP